MWLVLLTVLKQSYFTTYTRSITMNITKLTSNELQAEINLNALRQMDAYMRSDYVAVELLQDEANALQTAIEGMVAA